MHVNDYNYDLPEDLIAKYPSAERDGCRLLHLDKTSGGIEHLTFRNIVDILKEGDRLVFNNTRVIPARVFCRKETTGAAVELFFTERLDDGSWKALVRPAKRAPTGTVLLVDGVSIKISIDKVVDDGYERRVCLVGGSPDRRRAMPPDDCTADAVRSSEGTAQRLSYTLDDVINSYGHIPLPRYIDRADETSDRDTYQTVYADRPGAVAAPTAGLHFTNDLLDKLKSRGINSSYITLHVGIGTFRPVKVDDPRDHDMHEERFELDGQTAEEINETWRRGGRVIAVGTTVVRTLESCAAAYHKIAPKSGRTKLLILPPYDFKAVDGIITNFHLPKSTLLMLISAFASRESVLNAYNEAINQKYRFYSYGDAMFVG